MLGPLVLFAWTVSDPGRSIPVTSFHAVDLAARATVEVEHGPVAGVVVSGEPRLVRCVTADVLDGRLALGWSGRRREDARAMTKDGDIVVTGRVQCPRKGDARLLAIRVTTPLLDAVKISDQGVIHVAPMRTSAFAANIADRGTVTIDGLQASVTKLSIGGFGRISATGDLGKLAISIAGSGTIDARSASAAAVDVDVGGHGTVAATVDGPASGRLAGSGMIMIGGRPTCAIAKLGHGRIVCPVSPS